MSWRIAINHLSRYRYAGPVVASYNELRMTPVSSARQQVLETGCSVTPSSPLYSYRDYWGSVVHAFDIHHPHDVLEVLGRSVVETRAFAPVQEQVGWQSLRGEEVMDRFGELLAPTAAAPFDPAFTEVARQAADGASPLEALRRISEAVRAHLRYEAGTTQVTTSAPQAWKQGSGVCQDFAHVTLSLLRQIGIPARYTSGYLHPSAHAEVGKVVSGASHAWVEAWLGSWQPVDPTNGEPVGERHVTVAHGREYGDVSPFRGVYRGGALSSLDVEVSLERLA